MSTHAHTPGPWEINAPCVDEIVSDLGGADISVARMIGNPADARLIAAAPDLLQALQRARRILAANAIAFDCDGAIDAIDVAIARATGI